MRRLFARLDHPFVTVLLTVPLVLWFTVRLLALWEGDLSAFVVVGEFFTDPAHPLTGVRVEPASHGYDGQFYYRLALDPFTRERFARGVALDSPAYRQQRILYPLLAWLLSLGQPALVRRALVAVNVAGLGALAWVGGRYAQAVGRHALWGAAFSLYGGFLFTLARDLAEIIAGGLLLVGLLALQRGCAREGAVSFGLALLAKETVLLAALAALGASRRRVGWVWRWLPLAVYGAWQLWLAWQWGEVGANRGNFRNNIGPPGVGLATFITHLRAVGGPAERVMGLELGFLLAFGVGVLIALVRAPAPRHEKGAWLLYTGLALTLTRSVWVEDWAFGRALAEWYLLGVALLLQVRGWWGRAVLVGGIAAWSALAFDIVARFTPR